MNVMSILWLCLIFLIDLRISVSMSEGGYLYFFKALRWVSLLIASTWESIILRRYYGTDANSCCF